MKKYYKKILVGITLVLLLSGFYMATDIYFEISKNLDLFGKIFKEVSFNYVDEINPDEFMEAGIQGMLNSLDPYTVYIDENKKDEIDLITNGKYGGIGISVGVRGDKVTVVEVFEGYSAQRQGIRIGDVIVETDGAKISAETVKELSKYVKGEPGTKVTMKILRNSGRDTVVFNLIREEIIIKNITYYGFFPENSNNAYIKLSGFSRTAGEELRKAIKELKSKKPVKSLVIDVRNNPGGLLDIAVDICSKFLQQNSLVVSTKGRSPESEKKYFVMQEPILPDAKLVVLVNENSASASEIFAGAIQDNDRGIVVGEKTFGKGLVQTVTPLSFNTSLKITTARYYTPSGRSIQKIDYSKKNNPFSASDSVTPASVKYFTINKRPVYGSGGITPDSIVEYSIESSLTKELLAKGIFFEFADDYFYNHPDAEYNKIEDEEIFSLFKKYAGREEFEYKSDAEKEIDKLINEINESKVKTELNGELKSLKEQINKITSTEMRIFKKEIIREIRTELAWRYLGSEGKIKELLGNDEQFKTAVNLAGDDIIYKKLLNIK